MALPDSGYILAEDGVLAVPAELGVLANDTDQDDGDGPGPLVAELTRAPDHGTLQLHPNGAFDFTPEPDFFGSDSFSYRASDGTNYAEPVVVELEITELVDLVVSAVTDRETAGAPATVSHTLTIRNDGPSDATAVVVELQSELPQGVAAGAPVVSTGTVDGDLWALAISEGGSATLEISYTVARSAPGGIDSISTTATISSSAQPLTNLEDDTATVATGIISPEALDLVRGGSPTLSLQSALFGQELTITNTNPLPLSGFRLLVGGLPADVQLSNGHGTTPTGTSFVESDRDLDPGQSVVLHLEYFRPGAGGTFEPEYSIEAVFTEDPPRPPRPPPAPSLTASSSSKTETRSWSSSRCPERSMPSNTAPTCRTGGGSCRPSPPPQIAPSGSIPVRPRRPPTRLKSRPATTAWLPSPRSSPSRNRPTVQRFVPIPLGDPKDDPILIVERVSGRSSHRADSASQALGIFPDFTGP